jgi:Nitric oxide synthase, oxygenase domain
MFDLVLWSFVLALTPWTLGLAWKWFSVVGEWKWGILSRAIVEVRQWRSPHSRGIDASEISARWPAEGARGRDGSQQRPVRGVIGVRHALDMSTSSSRSEHSLWIDRALLEMNVAVNHSFAKVKISLVDHHMAARHFMRHIERKEKAQRAITGQWNWLVPPMSSSTTPVFHRGYKNTILKPNFF